MTAGDFNDGKDSGALRTIGEVVRALNLKAHVLRYWEQQFPSLQPLKRSGGRRYYRAEDVALLRRIDRLVNHEGYTIKGARLAIEGTATVRSTELAASQTAAPVVQSDQWNRAAVIDRLQQIRAHLVAALD